MSPQAPLLLCSPRADIPRAVFQHTAVSSAAGGFQSVHTIRRRCSIFYLYRRTDHVTFAEYGNTGPGASGTRASFSTKLSAPVAIKTVLNSTSWIDPAFL